MTHSMQEAAALMASGAATFRYPITKPTHGELLEFPILMEKSWPSSLTAAIHFETVFERPSDGSIWSAQYWRTPLGRPDYPPRPYTNTLAEGLCPIVQLA